MADTFLPKAGGSSAGTTNISAGTTTASASVDASCPQVRLWNSGTVTVFVRWGKGAQTATTSDMPIPPSLGPEAFTKGDADTIAAITSEGTATLYITSGHGN